jgi:hypothetical protein
MNLAIKFLPVLALFMLTACGPNLQSSDIKSDKNSLDNKAIVITRIHAPYTTFFGNKTDNQVNSIWERLDKTRTAEEKINYDLSRTGLFSEYNTFAIHDHMIEPGVYFLKRMTFKRGNTHFTITLPHDTLMFFKAKAGEVIYIGDLQIVENGRRASVVINDHYNDAVKYFKENRPEINKPIQKRLVLGVSLIKLKKVFDEMKSDKVKKANKP